MPSRPLGCPILDAVRARRARRARNPLRGTTRRPPASTRAQSMRRRPSPAAREPPALLCGARLAAAKPASQQRPGSARATYEFSVPARARFVCGIPDHWLRVLAGAQRKHMAPEMRPISLEMSNSPELKLRLEALVLALAMDEVFLQRAPLPGPGDTPQGEVPLQARRGGAEGREVARRGLRLKSCACAVGRRLSVAQAPAGGMASTLLGVAPLRRHGAGNGHGALRGRLGRCTAARLHTAHRAGRPGVAGRQTQRQGVGQAHSRRRTACCTDMAPDGARRKFSSVVMEATTEMAERVSAAEPDMFREVRNHWVQVFCAQPGTAAEIHEWLRWWAHR